MIFKKVKVKEFGIKLKKNLFFHIQMINTMEKKIKVKKKNIKKKIWEKNHFKNGKNQVKWIYKEKVKLKIQVMLQEQDYYFHKEENMVDIIIFNKIIMIIEIMD